MGKLNKKKMAELSDAAEVSDEKSNGGGADANSSTENAGNVSNDEGSDAEPVAEQNASDEEDEGEKITGDNDADDENDDAASSKKTSRKRKTSEKPTKKNDEDEEDDDEEEAEEEDDEEVPEKDDDADEDYVNGGSGAKKARKTNAKSNKKAGKKAAKKPKKSKKETSDDEGLESDQEEEGDDDDEEEEEYEVLDIVDKKVEKGVTLYKIRWKGYTKADDTWEPEDTLSCPDIIERFNKKHGDKPGKGGKATGKTAGKGRPAAAKTPAKAAAKDKTPKKAAAKSKGDTETEYEVDKIIDYAEEKGEKIFRIRWKGFKPKDDTWEPESNLNCSDLIEKFLEKMKDQDNISFKELREEPKKTKRLVNDRAAAFNPSGRKSRRTGSKKRVYYGDSDE